MSVEELLKTLKDGGMEDEAIKKLLSDALASLEGPAEEEVEEMDEELDEDAERKEASRYLGVDL